MKHFQISEFVDKATYEKYGERSIWFIDGRLVRLMDELRELFGESITINSWPFGGGNQWRGLRIARSAYHSAYSQHSFGRAVDFDVANHTAEEAREKIRQWHDAGLLPVSDITLELGVSWVHLDLRCHGLGLMQFNP